MTPKELAAIEARAETAPIGPWRLSPPHRHMGSSGPDCRQSVQGPNGTLAVALGAQCGRREWVPIPDDPRGRSKIVWHDEPLDSPAGAFIAHARSDVPALVAECRRLAAMLAKVQAVADELEERALLCARRNYEIPTSTNDQFYASLAFEDAAGRLRDIVGTAEEVEPHG